MDLTSEKPHNNRVIVITGMHRSGTSLIANVLQNAGVAIGERLIGGGRGNPRGHFEDLSFLSFHENILQRNKKTFLVQDLEGLRDFTPEDFEKAAGLIQERESHAVWGWKDPRTTLFLPFWHLLIPRANFVFLYRHPLTVCYSLLRRGAVYPEHDPVAGLNAWAVYNQKIIHFIKQNPGACFLGNIDAVSQDLPGFLARINDQFGLSLDTHIDPTLFHSNELDRSTYPVAFIEELKRLSPQPFELYEQLEKLAETPLGNVDAYTDFDKGVSAAIGTLVGKTAAKHEDPDLKVNYLFSMVLPALASQRTTRLNSLTLENDELASTVQSMAAQAAERDAFTVKLSNEINDLNTLAGSLQDQLAQRNDEIASLNTQLKQQSGKLKAKLVDLQAQIEQQKAETDGLKAETDGLKIELEQWKTEAVNYALSTSWRITRPLRKISQWIKGGNHAGQSS